MRILYLAVGLFFVGLGIIGAVLPVMPSTVFFLLAAIMFARSNPEWERRIMEHEKIGPPIRAFRERGAIPKSAKIAAVGAMTVSSLITVFMMDGWMRFLPGGICALCALYILTRPND